MTFAADRMLGRLAKWLRALGFDTIYCARLDKQEVRQVLAEGRVILTRDTRLIKELPPERAIFIKYDRLEDQLRQLSASGHIRYDPGSAFLRCMRCNQPLVRITKEQARENAPDYVAATQPVFYSCQACKRIYWPGTHHEHMIDFLKRALSANKPDVSTEPDDR